MYYFITGLIFLLISCKKNHVEKTAIFNVQPKLSYITPRKHTLSTSPAKIAAYKIVEDGVKETLYLTPDRITGFIYTEGYKYKIKVKIIPVKNLPAHRLDEEYNVIEFLSVEKD